MSFSLGYKGDDNDKPLTRGSGDGCKLNERYVDPTRPDTVAYKCFSSYDFFFEKFTLQDTL